MSITPDQHFARIERDQRQAEMAAAEPPGAAQARLAELLKDGVTPAAAREKLREVIDPELGIDIVSLGLVRDILFEDGAFDISFTVTTPGLPIVGIHRRRDPHLPEAFARSD